MSDQDQNFFDMFVLVLGILVGVTFGLILLARYVAGHTQKQWVLEDPVYQQQVSTRLEPFGDVALPGEDSAASAPVVAAKPVATAMSGPQVYNTACLACHGAGIGGAPKFGDRDAWTPRLAKGEDTLKQHALEGFTGSAGYMPPKGGRVDLSDEEVLSALGYMLDQVR